jgi:hypothetical protein
MSAEKEFSESMRPHLGLFCLGESFFSLDAIARTNTMPDSTMASLCEAIGDLAAAITDHPVSTNSDVELKVRFLCHAINNEAGLPTYAADFARRIAEDIESLEEQLAA